MRAKHTLTIRYQHLSLVRAIQHIGINIVMRPVQSQKALATQLKQAEIVANVKDSISQMVKLEYKHKKRNCLKCVAFSNE